MHALHALQGLGQSSMATLNGERVHEEETGRLSMAQHDSLKDTACLEAVTPVAVQKAPAHVATGAFR